MERNETNGEDSLEHIFEDNGGEDAIIGADDTGMVSKQRILIQTELEPELGEGGEEPRD